MVWDRQRHLLRLRGALRECFRECFPAALAAFDDLAAPEALELLADWPPRRTRRPRPGCRVRGSGVR